MAGINKVILIGNLGKDPEVRHLENGSTVANFSLATTESYKDKSGNWVSETEWHRIVAWRYQAEKAEKLKKGNKVYIEGKLKSRNWEDKEGVKRTTVEIYADNIFSLDAKKDEFSNEPTEPAENTNTNNRLAENGPENDLPF